ncbi:MAG: hypothetical protein RR482_04415 [Clostridia bacterium]
MSLWILRVCCLFLGLFFALPTACADTSQPEVFYFFKSYCESCRVAETFPEEFEALTGRSLAQYAYFPWNVRDEAGRTALTTAATRFGIVDAEDHLPLLIVEGVVYAGSEAIAQMLPASFFHDPASTASRLYYLYVPACESCAEADALLQALPTTVSLTRGNHTFPSQVEICRVDLQADPSLAQALFARYHIAPADQIAPTVLMGDQAFLGAQAIRARTETALRAGRALCTPLIAP